MRPRPDIVDRALEVWRHELPDLDLETEGLVERIHKLSRYLDQSLGETAATYGLTIAEWSLLGTIRKNGAPYRVPAGKLAEQIGITAGALTGRLDRLETRGLLRRTPDATDRRVTWIELTDEGYALWRSAVDVQAKREQLVASALDPRQQKRLNALLRHLMLSFEETAGAPPPRSLESP
ncbi:MAG: MarR family transcriptional regulator [Gaiellales bacterium]